MNPKILTFILTSLLMVAACTTSEDSPTTVSNITLEPSRIAANVWQTPEITPTATRPTPEPIIVVGAVVPTQTPNSEITPTFVPEVGAASTLILSTPTTASEAAPVPTLEPSPLPTSNAAELEALRDNPNLVLVAKMDSACFLAGDFIPFRLEVTSLETQPIYFYREGKWMLSINNSPVGPQLGSRIPTGREEFVEVAPSDTYTREEEDLGLWVQSMGPETGVGFSETGIGLPAGEYWVTFVYNNDQDGLQEQFGGTYLIDRAAWRGTAVAGEIRFRVVDDLTLCSS